jgi:hypothetical protein
MSYPSLVLDDLGKAQTVTYIHNRTEGSIGFTANQQRQSEISLLSASPHQKPLAAPAPRSIRDIISTPLRGFHHALQLLYPSFVRFLLHLDFV